MNIKLGLALFLLSGLAEAKLNVVTSLTDLRVIASEVGGEWVSVESIGKGTQDPHYVEAKPSFMVKANRADLFVLIGLDLEIGWASSIIRGARNPKIVKGQKGYLEVGPLVEPLEVPEGDVTRAEGDVHPYGNPHVWLDPIRAGKIAVAIGQRLGELDPGHRSQYEEQARGLQNRLLKKERAWKDRIEKTGIKRVVTYHKTLTYFLNRFGIANPAILEPKPGIPPTSGHILKVIQLIKEQKVPLIMVENFFDSTVTKKINSDVSWVRTVEVPVSVEGANGVQSLDDLYERLVMAIEGK